MDQRGAEIEAGIIKTSNETHSAESALLGWGKITDNRLIDIIFFFFFFFFFYHFYNLEMLSLLFRLYIAFLDQLSTKFTFLDQQMKEFQETDSELDSKVRGEGVA